RTMPLRNLHNARLLRTTVGIAKHLTNTRISSVSHPRDSFLTLRNVSRACVPHVATRPLPYYPLAFVRILKVGSLKPIQLVRDQLATRKHLWPKRTLHRTALRQILQHYTLLRIRSLQTLCLLHLVEE